jgi:uncharacterized membrane protein YqhA
VTAAGRAKLSLPAFAIGIRAMPLKRLLSLSRYVIVIAVVASLVGSTALLVYEVLVIAHTVLDVIQNYSLSPKIAKVLAVGMIEALDIFLIAIAAQIIGLGLYVLFIDDTLPLPRGSGSPTWTI